MSRFANDHERAFELLCMNLLDSVSDGERRWLESHLVQSTQRRVRALCMRQDARQQRMRPIWISSAFASVWMACTTPYLWQSFDLTGHWLHIPDLLWQMGFLVSWFTPALTGAAVALWLKPQLTRGVRGKMVRATA